MVPFVAVQWVLRLALLAAVLLNFLQHFVGLEQLEA